MRVLLIDNHDSFTWNLAQQIRSLGAACDVVRNDAVTVDDVMRINPDRIVLSPGPGGPNDAHVSNDILRAASSGEYSVPVLGVCLGHQCLGMVFGGKANVGHAPEVMHGKTSETLHRGTSIFQGIPSPFSVARYHSLVVKKAPKDCIVLAWTGSKKTPVIMAMKHKTLPLFGVQFHPESFLTEHGDTLIRNFLEGQW